MRTYYCGIDLHARFSVLGILDDQGQKVDEAKLDNDLSTIVDFLAPYGPDLHIAIESTINWYWLVDALQDEGYDVHLGHTLGLYMITGAKIKTDRRDAFKLAKYLRMEEFPEAYIYPKEKRPLRDFLRRRIGLVQARAECYLSLRIQLMRYNLGSMDTHHLKQVDYDLTLAFFKHKSGYPHQALDLKSLTSLDRILEVAARDRYNKPYRRLCTIVFGSGLVPCSAFAGGRDPGPR